MDGNGCPSLINVIRSRHEWPRHRTQSKTNLSMVWAWMLWPSTSLKEEHLSGLGMDPLVIELLQRRKLSLLRHECPHDSSKFTHSCAARKKNW